MNSPANIDPSRWDDLRDGLGDALPEIVDTYLTSTPDRLVEIRTALASGDMETVQRLAHSMKSSSGIFGAQEMVRLCKDLETAAAEGQTGLLEQIEGVQIAYEELARELRQRMTSLNASQE